jgi:Flp pilus assembly protein TadG
MSSPMHEVRPMSTAGRAPRRVLRFRAGDPRGQALIIFVLALVPILGMVGLVIDGGNAFAQRRADQNATDAAALAGALDMAENLPWENKGLVGPNGDADIAATITASAAENGVSTAAATYVNINGTDLGVTVGGGGIPAGAAGVRVVGSKTFDAYFTGAIGFPSFTVTTQATAVAGYVQNVGRGTVLPLTIPVNVTICDNNGWASQVLKSGDPYKWPKGTNVSVPICKGPASGNVGWLDWYGPAGGTSDLVESILHPNNPPIDIPDWVYYKESGNTNADNVKNAINTYAGEIVLIPLFDDTCDDDPGLGTNDCTTGNSGGGQNFYYHLPLFVAFRIASPAGFFDDKDSCLVDGNAWDGSSCLKGQFVDYIGPGVTVGPNPLPGTDYNLVGVQPIK